MYGRLSSLYGWKWQYSDKTLGPFVLEDIERYAGMITGWTPDGRKCTRPISEFDGLSRDGVEWHPMTDLLPLVPLETCGVQDRDLPLPVAFDEDP